MVSSIPRYCLGCANTQRRYWWADVPTKTQSAVYAMATTKVQGSPSIKYRAIFLNDEAPALSNWVYKTYGNITTGESAVLNPGEAAYQKAMYSKVMELILRLRANYLCKSCTGRAFRCR